MNAIISYHFKIPFPEELTDEQFADKCNQFSWLLKSGHINGLTIKNEN